MKTVLTIAAAIAIAGCTPPQQVAEYTPITDPATTKASFQGDLTECRTIAETYHADLKKRQSNEMMGNLLAGAIFGAAIGTAYGSEYANDGALIGGLAAANNGQYDQNAVEGGPRRLIDRCMVQRGHVVLNDAGAA